MLHSTSSGDMRLRARNASAASHPSHTPWRSTLALMALGALVGCGSGGGDSGPTSQAEPVNTPPAAVTGLVATAGNSPIVTLSWLPSNGADSYIVYWSENQGVTPASASTIKDTSSPHLHDGLTPGKRYHYVVTAVNAAGESAPSAEVSALLAPGAPESVAAVSGDSVNTVSWQAVPHAERYRVYWSTQANVDKTKGTPVDSNGSPWLHAGLQNGTPYYYTVTALGPGGEGPVSRVVSATPRVPIPGAPRDLTAQASADTVRSVTLAWLAPTIPANSSDILGYRVYRSVEPGVAANLDAATRIEGSSQTSLVDAVPIGGISYYYVVTALTAAGESAPSAEVSTTSSDGSEDGGGSGGSAGGGGSFNCGEPIACWQDSQPQ